MKKILPLILALTFLLTACGNKATPTIDAASVNATAISMAWTMGAQTQMALPSPTPIPPTATATVPPPPSPTPFVLPTFPVIMPTATTAGGACNGPMDANPGGPKVYVLISNRTKGSLTFSLYLNETAFACGFVRGVSFIGQNDSVGVTIPEGCYWPAAYINDPKKPRSHSGPAGCLHGNDKITLVVDYDGIKWIFP